MSDGEVITEDGSVVPSLWRPGQPPFPLPLGLECLAADREGMQLVSCDLPRPTVCQALPQSTPQPMSYQGGT